MSEKNTVTIIDYGVGNLFSLRSSFAAIGVTATVTADPAELTQAERIILPGVGAFGDAAAKLRACGMADALKAAKFAEAATLGGFCIVGSREILEKEKEKLDFLFEI